MAFEPEPGMFIENLSQFKELKQKVGQELFCLTLDVGHAYLTEKIAVGECIREFRNDIKNILSQVEIGILTSESEGLPVALLEYGLNKKAVVLTEVGEISLVVQDGYNGFLVKSKEQERFCFSLARLIENETLREDFGKALFKTIEEKYSEKLVMSEYLSWVATHLI